jgi:hypothetical protein
MTQLVSTPGSLRISRVTLPRYEMEYRDPQLALTHAASIQEKKALILEEELKIGIGQEVVFDFLIRDRPLRATLLFRLVQISGSAHILEWWSRRNTDPEMLEIWVAGLEGRPRIDENETADRGESAFPQEYAHAESVPKKELPKASAPLTTKERDEMLSLCRRLMLHNPFAALGIHWTAIPSEQRDAAENAKSALEKAARKCLGDAKLSDFLKRAEREIENALRQLQTTKQRCAIRERFVPREQLESSIDLAKHQLEMAHFRGQTEELPRLLQVLEELTGRSL